MEFAWPEPTTLGESLQQASRGAMKSGWLYLPKDWRTWNASTVAYVADYEQAFENWAATRDYASTLDTQLTESVVWHAQQNLNDDTMAAWIESFIYYFRWDALLPSRHAPDPPPWEETQLELDRDFYDGLGSERPELPCRAPGCTRGSVKFSVLCKVHQFEQVWKRKCPFED